MEALKFNYLLSIWPRKKENALKKILDNLEKDLSAYVKRQNTIDDLKPPQ